MKIDKEYFIRLSYFKKSVEDSFNRRERPFNKYQLASLVAILIHESYRN